MAIALTPILVAISVPIVGAFFQKRSAIIKEKRDYKHNKIAKEGICGCNIKQS